MTDPTNHLPLHTLRRIAAGATPTDSPMPAEPHEPTTPPKRLPRRERLALEAAASWRRLRFFTIEAIIDLRAEAEPALQSPNFTQTALFQAPRLDEIPASPEGKPPHDTDRSEKAERWRGQWYAREEALAQRRRMRHTRRFGPYHTWQRATSGAERGGLRPGQQAWPSAWTQYLLRVDPDGPMGESWGSALGVALKRLEKHYATTPMWTALWTYTNPRTPRSMARVEAAVGRSRRQCERWLDAALRRVVAETRRISYGAKYAGQETREAEEAEAQAWQNEPHEGEESW